MDIGSIEKRSNAYQYSNQNKDKHVSASMFQSTLSKFISSENIEKTKQSFEEMWKSRFPGAKYHVMDASCISQGVWERNDYPFEKFFTDEVDASVLNWQPSGKNPDMADASVQSRLNSTLGKKAIVVPPELEEKMKNNPVLAKKVMERVESFIQHHPTRPGRILSYLISLDEEGEIAHFRVTGGGGHISGPSEAELRQFEEEQKSKKERQYRQEIENKEYSLKVAEEHRYIDEVQYKQSLNRNLSGTVNNDLD
ncbi:hypothetical protein [Anaerovibrio lipolyticus]|uniref:hypothetical protein n=1 Tax=Anaerovibrio lipolyticus TaxID=82374 RepID=UPI00068845C2|nr:hypothetical protein [Anaerovibrio lipolyticus]